jgi:hypothetical protein
MAKKVGRSKSLSRFRRLCWFEGAESVLPALVRERERAAVVAAVERPSGAALLDERDQPIAAGAEEQGLDPPLRRRRSPKSLVTPSVNSGDSCMRFCNASPGRRAMVEGATVSACLAARF